MGCGVRSAGGRGGMVGAGGECDACKDGWASLTLAGSCEAVTGRAGQPSLSIDPTAYVELGGLMSGEHVHRADRCSTVESISAGRDPQLLNPRGEKRRKSMR
jgi:hypothetical protein